MYNSSFGLKFGLMFETVYLIAAIIACIFIYPFVFTVYGWSLMGFITFISFIISFSLNRKILKSFKENPSKLKEYWCALDWVIPAMLWIFSRYLTRPFNHMVIFIGIGYLVGSLSMKLCIKAKR